MSVTVLAAVGAVRVTSATATVRTGPAVQPSAGGVRVTGIRSSPVVSDPTPTKTASDPVAVRVASDAGSLASATTAVPFDITATVSLPAHAHVEQSTALSVRELTRPLASGTVDALIFPRARQSDGSTRDFDGVTLLTRMERAYPAEIVTLVEDTDISPLIEGTLARPRQVITYVFAAWAVEFPWFTYATVPELRTRVPNITNPDDWEPAWGGIPTRLISVTQDEDSPRSMLQMLEDLLSPFPGTQYYQNSLGQLQIRALYGPDADASGSAHVTLTNADVRTITAGEPTASSIVNRATATISKYQPRTGVEIMEPAYLQIMHPNLQNASVTPLLPASDFLQEPPTDRADLTVGSGVVRADRTWKLAKDVVLAADAAGISVLNAESEPLVTAVCNVYIMDGLSAGQFWGSVPLTVEQLALIPVEPPYDAVIAFGVRSGANYSSTSDFHARFVAQYDPSRQRVILDGAIANLLIPGTITTATRVAHMEFTLNGVSNAYVVSGTESVTFGNTSNGDSLPNGTGGNAISDSQSAYGLLEARISVRGYADFPNQSLRNIAQGYVLENLSPKASRDVTLTHRGGVSVTFDDRGRRIALPDGGEGILTGVEYAFDMNALSVEKRVRVEELIAGAPGAVDESGVYLFLDDNTFWLNDDDSISEPA